MRNIGKTATWALKSACVSAIGSALLAAGCNKMESSARQADRSIDENLAKSLVDRETPGEKGSNAVFSDLKNAAAMSDASAAGKVRAKSNLAQEEFARALALLPQIDQRALLIEQSLWDIRQTGARIQSSQLTGSAYAKREPKEVLAKVEMDRAEIKKNIDKSKADVQAAQMDLDTRQKEIDALKADRQKAEADADALAEQSSAAKGEESVKLFAQASDMRTKAGTLAARIESKTGALSPVQHMLAIAQKQQLLWDNPAKDASGAMQQLDERKLQFEAGWTDTQGQVLALNDSAKKLLATTVVPTGDGARANAGAKLVTLVAENEKLRTDAAKLLNDSIKHYGEAAAAAKQLRSEVQGNISSAKDAGAPDIKPLKSLIGLYDENQYLLKQGNSQLSLADLYAGQKIELEHRKQVSDDLAKVLQAGAMQLPQSLPAADPAKAIDDAGKAYKDAEATLDKVSNETRLSGDLQFIKNSALVSLLHAHLGRYSLTHDEDSKKAFNLDRQRAIEATLELPASLKKTLE